MKKTRKKTKVALSGETLRHLTLEEHHDVNGASVCGGTRISSCPTGSTTCWPPAQDTETGL